LRLSIAHIHFLLNYFVLKSLKSNDPSGPYSKVLK
jgi:hypothetical protein